MRPRSRPRLPRSSSGPWTALATALLLAATACTSKDAAPPAPPARVCTDDERGFALLVPERRTHDGDVFAASAAADAQSRALGRSPEHRAWFKEAGVLDDEGGFPWGEGHLYSGPLADAPPPAGGGRAGLVAGVEHAGTKPEQQDALGHRRWQDDGREVALLVVADGVSSAEAKARPAAAAAVAAFLDGVQQAWNRSPPRSDEAIERALLAGVERASFAAWAVGPLDEDQDGVVSPLELTKAAEAAAVPDPATLDPGAEDGRLACLIARTPVAARMGMPTTTLAGALVLGDDVWTVSVGDSVVALFRKGGSGGELVHLTQRDQAVVELFLRSGPTEVPERAIGSNVITRGLGRLPMGVRVEHYPRLLSSGDRLFVATDGIGLRTSGRGVDRKKAIEVLAQPDLEGAARALVSAQLEGLAPEEYQDNLAALVLDVVAPAP